MSDLFRFYAAGLRRSCRSPAVPPSSTQQPSPAAALAGQPAGNASASRGLRRLAGIAPLVSLAVGGVVTPMSYAQTSEHPILEYCYGSICGPTKERAIAAMEAAHPDYAGLFEETGKRVLWNGLNRERPLWFNYSVKPRKPSAYLPPTYGAHWGSNTAPTYCAASGDPILPNYCASDTAFIQGYVNWHVQIYGPDRVHHSVDMKGGYVMPFAEISSGGTTDEPLGLLMHNNWRNRSQMPAVTVTITNPNGTVAGGHGGVAEITKFTTFRCLKGFHAKTGASPAYNPGTWQPVSEATCLPRIGDQVITTRLRQPPCPPEKDTNPREGNPCYPVTGDKVQDETDFEFAGRPFGRAYHSLGQAEQRRELAPRWVHSYSDRISGNPTGTDPLVLTSDRGYLDVFVRVGSTNRFTSESGTGKFIEAATDGSLALTDASGLVRRFDPSGRLVRLDRGDTAWSIDLAYVDGRLSTATDQAGRQLGFDYIDERLAAIRLPDGQTVSYAYDADANLQSVTYPGGTSRTYHYNETGLSDANDVHALTGISNDGVRYATFAYDAGNRARLTQHHADGVTVDKVQLTYGTDGNVDVIGSKGESRRYTIAVTGGYRRAASVAHGDGTVSNTYNGAIPLELEDKLGIVTRYEFTDGHESARYEAYGTTLERKIAVERDSAYRIVSRTLSAKSGGIHVVKQKTVFAYNVRGQQTARCDIDPDDTTATSYTCDSAATAPSGVRKTATTYCEAADVANGSCPVIGLVTAIDGPRTDLSDVTSYTYYAADAAGCGTNPAGCAYRKGDLQRVTNARGHATEFLSYDGAGRPTVQMDANGVVSESEYDARGRLTAQKIRGTDNGTETDDRILRFEYWPEGMVKKIIQPDATFATFGYDSAQRLIRVADNAGNAIDYTLDAAGNIEREDTRGAAGDLRRTLSRTYDNLGREQSRTDAYGRSTTFTYDARDRRDITTDALLRVSDDNYDALDRLVRTLHDRDGIASETLFDYDALDRQTSVTDPNGHATAYTYDAFGGVVVLSSPDTGTTTAAYDQAGNRINQIDANGKVADYRYDALNRLRIIDYAAAVPDSAFGYDFAMGDCAAGENFNVGRLASLIDESGSTSYCYNRFGDLVRKVQRTANRTLTVRWQHHANGRLLKEIRPGNVEIDYQYDSTGRIAEIGVNHGAGRVTLLTGVTYHPFGAPAQWSYGNGRGMTRDVDLNYRPSRIRSVGGSDHAYRFDAVGNLDQLKDGGTNALLRSYGYDGLNRLTAELTGTAATPLREYGYDDTGNRTSATDFVATGGGPGPGGGGGTVQPVTLTYAYAAGTHRLAHDGIDPRAYDAAGNLIKLGSDSAPGGARKVFAYNEANRLGSVSRNTTLATYAYNAIGERTKRIAYGVTTLSLYDRAGQWIGDYNANGNAEQQLIWLGNLPVGVIVGNGSTAKLHYIEADALGTPRAVVDPVRDVAVWRWNADGEAFGKDYPVEDADADGTVFTFDLRFPGQRFDTASGLNYNYFRDYDPTVGRYVESDPLGLAGGISTYGYAGSGPLHNVDPFGLAIWTGTSYSVSGERHHNGGFIDFYSLSARCRNGGRTTAYVIATGVIHGRSTPVSMVGTYHVELRDSNADADPAVFRGPYTKVSGPEGAFGPGFGLGAYIRIGGANTFKGPHRAGGIGGELYSVRAGWAFLQNSSPPCKDTCD